MEASWESPFSRSQIGPTFYRPGATKAGLHKGEAFYRRADISELHTKDKWIQQGFEVKPVEQELPFKVVAKRGSKKVQTAGKDAGDAEEVRFFPSFLPLKSSPGRLQDNGCWSARPLQCPPKAAGAW